jgi:hypothetical protein
VQLNESDVGLGEYVGDVEPVAVDRDDTPGGVLGPHEADSAGDLGGHQIHRSTVTRAAGA